MADVDESALVHLKLQFPEGDVVVLRSGSPQMTVEWTRTDGLIPVVWFDGAVVQRDAFHPDALVALN